MITTHTRPFNLVGLAIGLLASSLAMAQEAAVPPADTTWQFTVGLGAVSQPRYPGSAHQKTSGFPVLSAGYGRYFIGGVPGAGVPAGVGAYLVQDEHWRLGVGLGGNLQKPRKESDSPRLQGLGDIDATALAAVFASYNDKWWTLRGNVLTDVGGKQQGTRLSMDAEARYPIGQTVALSAGPGFTWADAKYTQKFFGIDTAQSARSGLAPYTAKAGLNSVGFTVGADMRIALSWGLGMRVTASKLHGDAVNSPVTEKTTQTTVGLFAAYRF